MISNARIVARNVETSVYLRQEPWVKRGDPAYAMSRSELMLFESNPDRWVRGYTPKETAATKFGSLMDCRVIQPHLFEKTYAVQPATVKATKTMRCVQRGEAEAGDDVPWSGTCKEADDWKQAHEHMEILSRDDFEESDQALSRLREQPIGGILSASEPQVLCVAEYTDPATGITVPIKCLIDLLPNREHPIYKDDLFDYKTAVSAHPASWARVVDDYNYDAQAALELDIYNAATGEARSGFRHIIQEKTFPFQPAVARLSAEFIEFGREKVVAALTLYCQCLKTGAWPSWDTFNGYYLVAPEPWHSRLKPGWRDNQCPF